jgi:hypothetical protein
MPTPNSGATPARRPTSSRAVDRILFHGALWEFLRNDAMDSSDYFTQAVQPLKQNQFGATFGGPIIKDKTFLGGGKGEVSERPLLYQCE